MYCPTCGKPNPNDATFCAVCGNVFPGKKGIAAATIPPAAMTVPPKPGVTPRIGEVKVGLFAGRYELHNVLGKGGMGVVYRAKDNELGEEIAIKLLQPQFTKDAHEVERFKREILTARRITHPNVIRIHDYGTDGDEFFISMELLPGGTLADRIAQGITLPGAVEIAAGVAEGLGAAHAKRVVHRDIKPHNVLFDGDGVPKLVDFGIARFATATRATRGFAGTPHYISPEQAKGEEATERSDIYSLGVLFFELFTGKLPFDADSLVALAVKHAQEPPPPPRSIRPDLPVAIEAIVLRCLEKDPANRFQTPGEITAALRALAIGHVPATPIAPSPAPFAPSAAPFAPSERSESRGSPPPPLVARPAPSTRPPVSLPRTTPSPAITPYPPYPTTPGGPPRKPRSSGCLIATVLVGTVVASCAGLLILPPLVAPKEDGAADSHLKMTVSSDDDEPDDDSDLLVTSPVVMRTPVLPIGTPPSPDKNPDLLTTYRTSRYTTNWGWSFAPPPGWNVNPQADGTLLVSNPAVYGAITLGFTPGMSLDSIRGQAPTMLPYGQLVFAPTSGVSDILSGRALATDYSAYTPNGMLAGRGAAVDVDGGVAFILGVAGAADASANQARVDAVAGSMQSGS